MATRSVENNTLNLPKSTPLSGGLDDIPFVCVGDYAFLLSTYMMKPYLQKDLSRDKRLSNYRLSRARRISENVFGILANRWRVFLKLFLLKPEKVTVITYLVLILDNFLRSESTNGKTCILPNLVDFEDGCGIVISGDWRKDVPSGTRLDLEPSTIRNSSRQAKDIRENLKHFFMNKESVPWQWKAVPVDA